MPIANTNAFIALPANVDLNEKNKKKTPSATASNSFDFKKEDTIPDMIFSEIVWKAVKGEESEMPAPRRSAFLKTTDKEVSNKL